MKEQLIETKGGPLWIEDGVIRRECACVIENLEIAEETVAVTKKLANSISGKKLLLVDCSLLQKIRREARVYYAQKDNLDYLERMAFIVKNPVARVIASFFVGIGVQPIPIRYFNNEKEALDWLKSAR